MAGPRALVAEPSVPLSNALKRFLGQSGYEVTVVHFVDVAVLQSRKVDPQVVFSSVSGTFDGEALCAKLKQLKPHLPVVLTYPPEEELMIERAMRAGADAWLISPLKKAQVVAVAHAMVRQHALTLRVGQLEAELQKARLEQAPQSGSNTHDLTFFKKFLGLEVKRSKRYQYPLAFLMVALDALTERLASSADPEPARATIRAECVGAVGQLLRDIDLCVPFADDRLLVFLPHTARDGAQVVAARLVERLSKLRTFADGTASAGLAVFDPKTAPKASSVGFGSLMREASLNLRLAQESGGNRVEATPVAMQPKRERISIA
ncbi:MAG: response regulator [Archangiaceae bacterium]|nr:response regulator [Archangiaceae bacterium]